MNPSNRAYAFSTATTPVVYRSLPLLVPTNEISQVSNRDVETKMEKSIISSSKQTAVKASTPEFPCVLFENQLNRPIVRDSIDLSEIQAKLNEVCRSCELRRTRSACEFQCVAQAGDGREHCNFVVSIYQAPHSLKYLIQCDRYSGCSFFFNHLIKKTFHSDDCADNARLFRCPKLPESLNDQSSPDHSCVDSAIRLATSAYCEQRIQGIEVLAELIAENARLLEVFKSMNGFERISSLQNDQNDLVQRAYSRILVCA